MRDTPAAVEERFRMLLLQVAPEERLAMSCRMFATAKALIRAAIEDQGPISREELRSRVFLRLYGLDYSDRERARIIAHLMAT